MKYSMNFIDQLQKAKILLDKSVLYSRIREHKSIKHFLNKYNILLYTLFWFKCSADNIKSDYSALNAGIVDNF